MAVDFFLILDGIKGESKDDAHKEAIEVLAWSWGASNSATTHSGGGGGAGKANVQDLSITKYIDKSSPKLFTDCFNGTHIKTGKLICRKAGGKPLEYLTLELTEIVISSTSTGGSGGEDRLTENISLNFAKVDITYVPQNDDGSPNGSVPAKIDIAGNKAT